MKKEEYDKPLLRELDEISLEEIDGGVGFIVVAGTAVAVLVAAAGYTVVVAATLVSAGAAVNVGMGYNIAVSSNTVTVYSSC